MERAQGPWAFSLSNVYTRNFHAPHSVIQEKGLRSWPLTELSKVGIVMGPHKLIQGRGPGIGLSPFQYTGYVCGPTYSNPGRFMFIGTLASPWRGLRGRTVPLFNILGM